MVQQPEQVELHKTPPYLVLFTVNCESANPLEKANQNKRTLINSGRSEEFGLTKLELSEVPITGSENYKCSDKV